MWKQPYSVNTFAQHSSLVFYCLDHFFHLPAASRRILSKSRPDSGHVLLTKWHTRDSFQLLKGQREMCANPSLSPFSPLPLSALLLLKQCVFGFFLWVTLSASLCLKKRVMGPFILRKRPHTESKGLSVAPYFSSSILFLPVKTEKVCSFYFDASVRRTQSKSSYFRMPLILLFYGVYTPLKVGKTMYEMNLQTYKQNTIRWSLMKTGWFNVKRNFVHIASF